MRDKINPPEHDQTKTRGDPAAPLLLTTAPSQRDIQLIVYGFKMRDIQVHVTKATRKRYFVYLVKGDPTLAMRSVEPIWDAILETHPRAIIDGQCAFCGYNAASLYKPATCPECGRSLDTIQARLAARDQIHPDPEDTRGVP